MKEAEGGGNVDDNDFDADFDSYMNKAKKPKGKQKI